MQPMANSLRVQLLPSFMIRLTASMGTKPIGRLEMAPVVAMGHKFLIHIQQMEHIQRAYLYTILLLIAMIPPVIL